MAQVVGTEFKTDAKGPSRAKRRFLKQRRGGDSTGVAGALGLAAATMLAAGCQTTEPPRQDAYAAATYAGARSRYEVDRVAPLAPPAQFVGEQGVLLVAERYDGVVGARAVHARYPAEVAEKLDGDCESHVRAAPGEDLRDLADYCDVDIAKLVAYNPAVSDPYNVATGLLLEIPGGVDIANTAGIATLGADATGVYRASAGETISDVAYRFDVPAAQVSALNPGMAGAVLIAGEPVRMPASAFAGDWSSRSGAGLAGGSVSWATQPRVSPGDPSAASQSVSSNASGVAAAVPAEPAAASTTWLGYDGAPSDQAVADDAVGLAERHMPYRLGPQGRRVSDGASRQPVALLTLDRSVVAAGGRVTVSLSGVAPYEEVTFYRGKNVNDMESYGTVVADSSGVASKTFTAPAATSDLGGYIFRASRSQTDDAFYSNRVSVVKLRPDAD